eukprot:scaffold72541_cov32-Tisochrysis_lutea.AAC.2
MPAARSPASPSASMLELEAEAEAAAASSLSARECMPRARATSHREDSTSDASCRAAHAAARSWAGTASRFQQRSRPIKSLVTSSERIASPAWPSMVRISGSCISAPRSSLGSASAHSRTESTAARAVRQRSCLAAFSCRFARA